MWLDDDDLRKIGDTAFLIEIVNTSTGVLRYVLRDEPARTNGSHEPRLTGWCGETDNRSIYARGMVEVSGFARDRFGQPNGRVRVRALNGAALLDAATRHGYPALVDSSADTIEAAP